MKNIISVAILLLVITITKAQTTATATIINNKDVNFLLKTSKEFAYKGSVHLSDDQILQTKNLEDRAKLFISNAPTQDFDGIFSRDGRTAILMKYTGEHGTSQGTLLASFKKDIYMLSNPVKEYNVLKSLPMTLEEIQSQLPKLIDSYIEKSTDLTYDALLITKDKVEFILYK